MADVEIVIGSITYAMKAKKALSERGINARIIKYEGLRHRGCSYGLKIKHEHYISLVGILNQFGIHYQTLDQKNDSLS